MSEWSDAEKRLIEEAQRSLLPDESVRSGLAKQLLDLTRRVFERSHVRHPLRKSGEVTRAMRLLAHPRLFPGDPRQDGRLAFCLQVLEQSDQRPVQVVAALQALDHELDHRWSEDTGLRDKALMLAERARLPVMPLIALESQLIGHSTATEQLEGMDFDQRRLRLVELIDVLDTYPTSTGLGPLVEHTFEAVFAPCTDAQRTMLVERLLVELKERGERSEQRDWGLLLRPLMLQNAAAFALQGQVLDLVHRLPAEALTPYLQFYLRTTPPQLLSVERIAWAGECGVELVPLLYPLTEQRTWLRQPTGLAHAAQQALEQIMAREGLQGVAGGLTLVDDLGQGALSLAAVKDGALSTHAALPAAVPERSLSPLAVISAGAGLGAFVGLLIWVLG